MLGNLGVRFLQASVFTSTVGLRGFASLFVDFGMRVDLLSNFLGAAAGVSVNFCQYALTSQYFLFPSLWLSIQTTLRWNRTPSVALRIALPMSLHFRKDLEYGFSVGLSCSVLLGKKS